MKNVFIFLFLITQINYAKTVMVFGCFDLFHPGHVSFLQQAKKYGDRLIVIVARDAIIYIVKKRMPFEPQTMRMQTVKQHLDTIDEVYLGDSEFCTYTQLRKIMPDIICLGYDQHGLGKDLSWRMQEGLLPTIPLIYLEAFEPDKYHTSIIRKDFICI